MDSVIRPLNNWVSATVLDTVGDLGTNPSASHFRGRVMGSRQWVIGGRIESGSYGGPKVSRQFQSAHGNFNLFTAISILLTAISIYSRQFRNFTQGTFNFFTATLTAFFASLTTLSATAADSGLAPKSNCLRVLERLRISAQYRVRIPQSRKDICRRFWLASF